MSKFVRAKKSNRDSRARIIISAPKFARKHSKLLLTNKQIILSGNSAFVMPCRIRKADFSFGKKWLKALETDSSIPMTVERAKAIFVNKAPGVGVLSSIPIASAKGAFDIKRYKKWSN